MTAHLFETNTDSPLTIFTGHSWGKAPSETALNRIDLHSAAPDCPADQRIHSWSRPSAPPCAPATPPRPEVVDEDAAGVAVAAHWRAHHEIFRYVGSLSGRLTRLTLAWLFMQVLASATFALIIREIRREQLYRTDVIPPEFAQSLVRSICLAAVFGASVPLSFLITGTGAYLCWLAAPIVLVAARRIQSRTVRRPPAS